MYKININNALNLAQAINSIETWVSLFRRHDLSIEEAIGHATILNDESVWSALVSRDDFMSLSIKRVTGLAQNINHWVLWDALVSRKDLDIDEALKYAVCLNNSYIWDTVLSREDLRLHRAVDYLIHTAGLDNCDAILKRKDFKDLPLKKAVEHAERIQHWKVWDALIDREDTTLRQKINYKLHIVDSPIGNDLINLAEYDTMPIEEILTVVEMINSDLLWETVVRSTELPIDIAIKYVVRVDFWIGWNTLLKRKDFDDSVINFLLQKFKKNNDLKHLKMISKIINETINRN